MLRENAACYKIGNTSDGIGIIIANPFNAVFCRQNERSSSAVAQKPGTNTVIPEHCRDLKTIGEAFRCKARDILSCPGRYKAVELCFCRPSSLVRIESGDGSFNVIQQIDRFRDLFPCL